MNSQLIDPSDTFRRTLSIVLLASLELNQRVVLVPAPKEEVCKPSIPNAGKIASTCIVVVKEFDNPKSSITSMVNSCVPSDAGIAKRPEE